MLLSLLASTALVQAQDATWIGTAGPPNNWNTAANWSPTPAGPPAFVPTGTAFFNSSLLTTTTIEAAGNTTVGGLTFTNAPGYTFTVPALATFVLNGAGVAVDAGSAAPNFSVSASGTFALINSATAGRSIIDINTGGQLVLVNTSSAGSAIITNSGVVNFNDGSNGGTATIFNNAGFFLNFNLSGGPSSASAGSATIDNSGTTVFYNSSTAGNSTLTTRSGASTFFINQSSAGASQQNVMTGAALTFQNSSSAGSSTITNSGTVNFNDTTNAGSSNITNNAGGFVFFSQAGGSASASNSTINNSGNILFANSSTAANATIITGPGGQTFFTGQATGGTTSIVINSTGFLGGLVNISGITDPSFTIGSLAGNLGTLAQFTIGAKSLIVGTNNTSTSYGGVIFDSGAGGSLTKIGTGTLTLAGVAVYNGTTTITGGTLNITGSLQQTSSISVGASGTLAGTGTITTPGTVTVNGTLAPGTTTGAPFIINGSLLLNGSATYVSNIVGGVASWTFVNGVATLGGTLRVRVGSGGVNFQTPYTLLASSQPLVQQFATLDLPGTLKSQIVYNANNVQIIFSPDLAAFAVSGNGNQRAVGSAIQTGLASAINPGAFGALLNLDRANLLAAFTQLSGEIATGAAPTGFGAMNSFITTMVNPFLDARGSGTPRGPSLAFAPEAPLGYVRERKASNAATQAFAQLQGAPQRDTRFTTWVSGYGAWARNDGDASAGSNVLQSRVAGAAAGLDYRPTFDTVFGIAMGGAQTSYTVAGGNGDANIAQVGVHGAVRLNNAYFSSAFAYGWHAVSTSRVVTLLAPDAIKASYDGHSVSGRIEFGSRYGIQSVGVTPFAAAQVQQFFSPAYREAGGASAFALSYSEQSTSSLRSELGVWLDAEPARDLRLRGRIAWGHEFSNPQTATASFITIPSGPFTVTGTQQGRDALLASAAAEWLVERNVALTARFDTELSRTSSSYSGMGGVRFNW